MSVRRIRRLRIEGFGHFREQEWDIHPRLHLFEGRNEAGKSTLLAFVRGVLFGFESRTSPRRYEPFFGGPFGGDVWMEDEHGQWVRIRRDGRERVAGRLTVALPDGRTAGEDWLHQWLGGIDKATYRQVFAFGLDDLQRVRWVEDEALTPFLYHTLTGGGSLEAVRKQLFEREAALFRPRGKSGPIHALLRELEALQSRERTLRRQQPDVTAIRRQLAQMETEVADLEREMAALQDELERREQMDRMMEPFRRLQRLSEMVRQEGWLPGLAAGAETTAIDWQALRVQEEARLNQLSRFQPRTERSDRRRPENRREQGSLLAWAAVGLGAIGGLGWLWAWRTQLSPAVWAAAAVLGMSGLVSAFVIQWRRRQKRLRHLAAERERLQAEEERIRQVVATSERRLEVWREAETLAAVLGPWHTDPAWRRELAAWAQRSDEEQTAERRRLETALSETMQRYSAALEERGRLMQQLDGARQQQTELEDVRLQLRQRKAQLQQLAHQWAVTVLARRALETSMAAFERERQPRTLQQVAVYFSRLTGGRYRRVLAPYGRQGLLVERDDGDRLPLLALSRGTVEQLLLAMRLALADEFSQRTVLPLMMDDIFVNFDADRLALAVDTLKTLAERRQIVFLTCHPHVAAAFRRALEGDDWGYEMLDRRFS